MKTLYATLLTSLAVAVFVAIMLEPWVLLLLGTAAAWLAVYALLVPARGRKP